MLAIDEDIAANEKMYRVLKNYIDNRSFLFPIMDKMNSTNFTLWFSQHLENSANKKE